MNDVDEQDAILEFLESNPDMLSSRKKVKPDPKSIEGQDEIRRVIAVAQDKTSLPRKPNTTPDEAVSVILRDYYDIPTQHLDRIKEEHQLSMSAENIVGELLEDYIRHTSKSINSGWVRAHGDVVKSVDFIKKVGGNWELLQIKNRDNSENSSSKSVRDETIIKKWFRTFAKTGNTNWDNFPDIKMSGALNEANFQKHISEYLAKHK
jgi:hypothetical protein